MDQKTCKLQEDVDYLKSLDEIEELVKKLQGLNSATMPSFVPTDNGPANIANSKVLTTCKSSFHANHLSLRQIERNSKEVKELIALIKSKMKTKKVVKFRSPHHYNIQERRWDDFKKRARRSLFCIVKSIEQLSNRQKVATDVGSYLRNLGGMSRSVLLLLKKLALFGDQLNTELKCPVVNQILSTALRLLTILAGATTSEQEYHATDVSMSDSDAIFIESSDLDSSFANIINPIAVKTRLLEIQNQYLQMKETQIDNNRVVKPQNLLTSAAHGHHTELIQDSLTRLMRNKFLDTSKKKTQKSVEPTLDISADQLEEKVADACFQKLLPLIQLEQNRQVEASQDSDLLNHIRKRLEALHVEHVDRVEFIHQLARPDQEKRCIDSPSCLELAMARANSVLTSVDPFCSQHAECAQSFGFTHESRQQRENLWVNIAKRKGSSDTAQPSSPRSLAQQEDSQGAVSDHLSKQYSMVYESQTMSTDTD